jgi:hypothetical protein
MPQPSLFVVCAPACALGGDVITGLAAHKRLNAFLGGGTLLRD